MADANIVNSSLNPKKKKKQLFRDQPRKFSPQVEKVLVEGEGVSSPNTLPTAEPETLEKEELHTIVAEAVSIIPETTEENAGTITNQVEVPAKPVEKIAPEPIKEADLQEEKGRAPKGLVNQASTIKISKEAKKKFDAIRMATGSPSAYQLLELMMDAYYEQHLTPAQKQVVDATSMI